MDWNKLSGYDYSLLHLSISLFVVPHQFLRQLRLHSSCCQCASTWPDPAHHKTSKEAERLPWPTTNNVKSLIPLFMFDNAKHLAFKYSSLIGILQPEPLCVGVLRTLTQIGCIYTFDPVHIDLRLEVMYFPVRSDCVLTSVYKPFLSLCPPVGSRLVAVGASLWPSSSPSPCLSCWCWSGCWRDTGCSWTVCHCVMTALCFWMCVGV